MGVRELEGYPLNKRTRKIKRTYERTETRNNQTILTNEFAHKTKFEEVRKGEKKKSE